MSSVHDKITAVQDYQRLRERAILQEIVSRLTNNDIGLLSYEDVRNKLHVQELGERGLKDIPLDKIVGSVGRYRDFTRNFLPRGGASQRRWVDVKTLATGSLGFPPIEVYQVGDVYFIKDGNHRVSVAKEMGWKSIPAFVIACETPVNVEAGVTPADIIEKQEEADFARLTNLNKVRPKNDIHFTLPGGYTDLLAHIAAHQYFMEQAEGAPVEWERAVASWYDSVYLPLTHVIQEHNLLQEFPHRTLADIYVWIVRHELDLRQACQVSDVDDTAVVEDFASLYSERPLWALVKGAQRLYRFVTGRILGRKPPVCEI